MNKCKLCREKYETLESLLSHLEEEHDDEIPKDFTPSQFNYAMKTGKSEGKCVECGNKTKWNEKTYKYFRFCERPECKARYVERFQKNMIGQHGKITLLGDADHQRKMLANRSISGKYKWSDGVEISYTGSYELDFLRFLDIFMEFESSDIMSPSPHTYYYMYEGEKKFYIPDLFIPSLNLEIEIKDGGDNPNNHHKIQDVDKKKEKLKDAVLMSQKTFSYIKLVNKKYDVFFEYLSLLKQQFSDNKDDIDKEEPIFIVRESAFSNIKDAEIITEGFDHSGSIYHVSKTNIDGDTLYPRIPTNFFIKHGYEDNKTPRISFSNSIAGCLAGLSQNIEGMKFYVYEPEDYNKIKTMGINVAQVPDAGVTGEVWVVSPVKLKLIAEIEVGKAKEPPVKFEYGADKSAEIYNWNWKFIKRYDGITVIKEQTDWVNAKYPVFILLTYTATNMSKVIRFFTGDPYSHASISFDSSMVDAYSFGRKYKDDKMKFINEDINIGVLKDVSENTNYSLYVTFVTEDQYIAMTNKLSEFKSKAEDLKFSFIGLFNIALGNETSRENEYFCSQFVAEIIKAANAGHLNRDTSLYTPYGLASMNDTYFVARGKLKNYNKHLIDEKVMYIRKHGMATAIGESSLAMDHINDIFKTTEKEVIGRYKSIPALPNKFKVNDRPVIYFGLTQKEKEMKEINYLITKRYALKGVNLTLDGLTRLIQDNNLEDEVMYYTKIPVSKFHIDTAVEYDGEYDMIAVLLPFRYEFKEVERIPFNFNQ